MLEARAFVTELDSARKILLERGAVLKGEYRSKDVIFAPIDPAKSIADEFLRLRVHYRNIWNEKNFLVAIKQTKPQKVGKISDIPMKQGFDSEAEARQFIEENFFDKFKYDFEVVRTGWQYDLGEDQIDLEKIEDISDCYSIEVKSLSEVGVRRLLGMLEIKLTITGPSVVDLKNERLKSHETYAKDN